ncbi:uncharacterized protein MONOS_379 [Monocercomonoides exilis]|uniref:uncharacterized protein n=1 Tax=Monocercomonoides exilis TaxID=2049356 RepID=UPI00355A44C4|nr:hypothetical protein MONOS_379 [Monocercomonoides exilis]|eukprot:MONOS_379.1-p1 / transcript=MONOS_379.1 / gene=MONOS_379 / organism=Monocercomonoides_exilis_PA203 / gene_product=unspecified product / transcript_product=unspecified product / location=Mono_scaffold00006:128209-130960(-) / protein_length=897 / sequence_SO=supercontig / SO=protein_coding / is_pseudo=false
MNTDVQKVGMPSSQQPYLASAGGPGESRFVVTNQLIECVFLEYPQVKEAYDRFVPDKISAKDFWKSFFKMKRSVSTMNEGQPKMQTPADILISKIPKDPSVILQPPPQRIDIALDSMANVPSVDGVSKAPDRALQSFDIQTSTLRGTALKPSQIVEQVNRHGAIVLQSQFGATPTTTTVKYDDGTRKQQSPFSLESSSRTSSFSSLSPPSSLMGLSSSPREQQTKSSHLPSMKELSDMLKDVDVSLHNLEERDDSAASLDPNSEESSSLTSNSSPKEGEPQEQKKDTPLSVVKPLAKQVSSLSSALNASDQIDLPVFHLRSSEMQKEMVASSPDGNETELFSSPLSSSSLSSYADNLSSSIAFLSQQPQAAYSPMPQGGPVDVSVFGGISRTIDANPMQSELLTEQWSKNLTKSLDNPAANDPMPQSNNPSIEAQVDDLFGDVSASSSASSAAEFPDRVTADDISRVRELLGSFWSNFPFQNLNQEHFVRMRLMGAMEEMMVKLSGIEGRLLKKMTELEKEAAFAKQKVGRRGEEDLIEIEEDVEGLFTSTDKWGMNNNARKWGRRGGASGRNLTQDVVELNDEGDDQMGFSFYENENANFRGGYYQEDGHSYGGAINVEEEKPANSVDELAFQPIPPPNELLLHTARLDWNKISTVPKIPQIISPTFADPLLLSASSSSSSSSSISPLSFIPHSSLLPSASSSSSSSQASSTTQLTPQTITLQHRLIPCRILLLQMGRAVGVLSAFLSSDSYRIYQQHIHDKDVEEKRKEEEKRRIEIEKQKKEQKEKALARRSNASLSQETYNAAIPMISVSSSNASALSSDYPNDPQAMPRPKLSHSASPSPVPAQPSDPPRKKKKKRSISRSKSTDPEGESSEALLSQIAQLSEDEIRALLGQ